nr:hypothetical protein [Pandoravirus aubagnensis]
MNANYIQRRCIRSIEESERSIIREACEQAVDHLAQQERKAVAARAARLSIKRPAASGRSHQKPSLAVLPNELLDKIAASIDAVGDICAWSIATGLSPCRHRLVAAIVRNDIDITTVLCAGAPLHIIQALAAAPTPSPSRCSSISTIEAAASGGRVDVFEWIAHGRRSLLPYWGVARTAAGFRALVGAAWRGHAHMIAKIEVMLFPIVPLSSVGTSVDGAFNKAVEVAVSRAHFAFLAAVYNMWPDRCGGPLIKWALVHDSPRAIEAIGGLAPLGCRPDPVFRCAVDAGAWRVARWLARTYPDDASGQ